MTLEFSLRRRATRSRYLALLWLSVAIIVLVGTYVSIPFVASRALLSVSASIHSNNTATTSPSEGQALYFAMGMLLFGLSAIALACYFLGRNALIELEMAARSNGLADALCIAGGNMDTLEKASSLLVPRGRYSENSDALSKKERESMIELIKLLRKSG